VATVHDLGFLRVPETFSKGFVWRSRVLIRRTARRAAAVITGSEHARRDILSTYKVPEDRVEVVPCGVDPAFFSPADPAAVEAAAARYGLTGPYVLCVGRLNPRKNLPALARAFARFKKETGRPHRLVIVGRADFETERTRAEVREEGGPDVLLTGVVPDADLADLVKGAEIFVYPSLFEGVGLPAAEALAAGVPVITSNTTSMPETAGGAALLVDPLREDELAAALARLASDPDLRRSLSEKGRLRAKAFSWDEAARRTLAIYDRVVR
jgi:glycosyltransferase involved in cell wall biosynthesis